MVIVSFLAGMIVATVLAAYLVNKYKDKSFRCNCQKQYLSDEDRNKYKYLQPKIKFNGGIGALLCNRCNTIIKDNLTKEEWDGKTDLLLCDKCLDKLKDETITH